MSKGDKQHSNKEKKKPKQVKPKTVTVSDTPFAKSTSPNSDKKRG